MVSNILRGGAAINALARAGGTELRIVDAGVACDIRDSEGLIRRRIARGTKNFCKEPAMSRDHAIAAACVGIEMANGAATDGCQLLGIGEMGIGNTTAASAMTAMLTGLQPARVVGHGTGTRPSSRLHRPSAIAGPRDAAWRRDWRGPCDSDHPGRR